MILLRRASSPTIDSRAVLAIHGAADRIVPPGVSTARLRDEHLVDDLTVVEIPDGSHVVCWTHAEEVNSALLSFLGSEARDRPAEMAATG